MEASGAAHFAAQLIQAHPHLSRVITVLHSKVEEVVMPEKVSGCFLALANLQLCTRFAWACQRMMLL